MGTLYTACLSLGRVYFHDEKPDAVGVRTHAYISSKKLEDDVCNRLPARAFGYAGWPASCPSHMGSASFCNFHRPSVCSVGISLLSFVCTDYLRLTLRGTGSPCSSLLKLAFVGMLCLSLFAGWLIERFSRHVLSIACFL